MYLGRCKHTESEQNPTKFDNNGLNLMSTEASARLKRQNIAKDNTWSNEETVK